MVNDQNDQRKGSAMPLVITIVLKYSVRLMEMANEGIVNKTLKPAPLYSAKNPSFLYATARPWKIFRYP